MALASKIDLGDFAPDDDPQNAGNIQDMDGFSATTRGLRVMPGPKAFGSVLPSPPIGSFNATLVSGEQIPIVGTAEHLYRLQGGAWLEFDSGQTFTASGDTRWRYAVFGNDIIAVNGITEPQISVDAAPFVPVSTLPGYKPFGPGNTPPITSIVESTDFGVFMVFTNSNQWVADILNDRDWKPSIATSVASAFLTATPGPILACHRLRGGIAVYKKFGLYFGQFTGPPFFWSFQSLSEQVGTHCNECVVNAGDVHYFVGPDDFYVFDGSSLQRIPNNVKTWFFDRVDERFLDKVLGQFDRATSTVFWYYSTIPAFRNDNLVGINNEWIAYNTRTGKWTKGMNTDTGGVVDVILPDISSVQELTYQEFGDRYQTYNGTDSLTYDSEDFGDESNTVPGIWGPNGQMYTLDGPPTGAFLLTGEIGDGNHFWQITELRPIFAKWPLDNYGKLTGYFSTINGLKAGDEIGPDTANLAQPYTGPTTIMTRTGSFFFIQNGRSQQFRIEVKDHCELTGFELSAVQVGRF